MILYMWPDKSISIKKPRPEIRAQAQGLFVLVSYGVGQGLGALAAGSIFNRIMGNGSSLLQWQQFWIIPLIFAAVVITIVCIWIQGENEGLTEWPQPSFYC